MRHRTPRRRAALVVAILPLWLSGCPIPLAHTEAISAPVIGHLMRADGLPVPDAELVISTAPNDSICTQDSLRATTDATGTFQLPGATRRHAVAWVVPNFDPVAPRFWLCALLQDTLRPAYLGEGSLRGAAEPDSLICIAWEWEAQPRVTCSGRAGHSVVEGGQWADSTGGNLARGFYRVFLTEKSILGQSTTQPIEHPRVFVQWVEVRPTPRRSGEPPYHVRQTVALAINDKVRVLHDGKIWYRAGTWGVSLYGFKQTLLNPATSTELNFGFGAPGQVTAIPAG